MVITLVVIMWFFSGTNIFSSIVYINPNSMTYVLTISKHLVISHKPSSYVYTHKFDQTMYLLLLVKHEKKNSRFEFIR